MLRVPVDFNERCSQGHVRAGVPNTVELHLLQTVEIYDPFEPLATTGKVMQITPVRNADYKIVHFAVDWSGFHDGTP